LLDAGARRVLLAGSGSSVFGIFSSAEAQHRALEGITAESDWRVFACDSLSRGEYLRALGSSGLRSYALPK
jgi:4-diphosphocytidyl-2C-methyl-D-erythritol kinase